MKIKTQDLIDGPLDWAVAKCKGLNAGVLTIDAQIGEHENIMRQHFSDAEWEEHLKAWNKHVLPTIKPQLVAFDDEGFPIGFPLNYDGKGHRIAYSTTWAQGGPIIERERMQIAPLPDNGWRAHWRSFDRNNLREVWMDCFDEGVTPLVAAMRCYVASRLGDEVEVPDELLA